LAANLAGRVFSSKERRLLEMLWLVMAGHYGFGLIVTQDRAKEQANNSGRIPG
jgi:hypothetical protein